MTHLSDFSYLDRGAQDIVVLIFMLYYIHHKNRFRCFEIRNFREKKLRSFIALFLILSLVIFLGYDINSAVLKYREGFEVIYPNGTPFEGLDDYNLSIPYVNYTIRHLNGLNCITKAATLYTTLDHSAELTISGVFLNFSWTLKSCGLFLLLSNWNHLFSRLTKKSIMSTWEFKIYIIYSIISFFLYFAMQLIFLNNSLLSGIAPQFIAHVENVVLAILTEITNYRFHKAKVKFGEQMERTLDFWITMNHVLAVALLLDGCCLGAINVDIVGNWLVIYKNKFWTDLLTVSYSVGYSIQYAVVIFILFRKEKRNKDGQSATRTLTQKEKKYKSRINV